jgi:GNAT superfamily N-acetyltransferase
MKRGREARNSRPFFFSHGLALAATLALGAHAFTGGAALSGADRAVAVGVDPREQGKGVRARFLARHAAVAIRIRLAEHAAAEAGEYSAALAAALCSHPAMLGALPAHRSALVELGAADNAVAVATITRSSAPTAAIVRPTPILDQAVRDRLRHPSAELSCRLATGLTLCLAQRSRSAR